MWDIISVNYKSVEYYPALLKSLQLSMQNIPYNFIIVNNDNNDEIFKLKEQFPYITIIPGVDQSTQTVCAHADAAMIGQSYGTNEYISIIDPDTIFLTHWETYLRHLLDNNLCIFSCQDFISPPSGMKVDYYKKNWHDDFVIGRPHFMCYRRSVFNTHKLKLDMSYLDTAGNITKYCKVNNYKYSVLSNSFNQQELKQYHELKVEYGYQCFMPVGNFNQFTGFFYHFARGATRKSNIKSMWHRETEKYLRIWEKNAANRHNK